MRGDPSRGRHALKRAHPFLALRLLQRTAADTASYGAVVTRTTGLRYGTRPRGERKEPAWRGRTRNAAAKAWKVLRKGPLPLVLFYGVYAERRRILWATRARLRNLAAAGVGELFLCGTAFDRASARVLAADFGIEVAGEFEDVTAVDAAALSRRPGAHVLIAAPHGIAQRKEQLQGVGVAESRISVLVPCRLEAERSARLPPSQRVDAELSVVVPTRGRPDQALRLLGRMEETLADPKRVEVLLCVDDDDAESGEIRQDGLWLEHLVLPRTTMGARSEAAYRRCRGRRVMFFNDDVEIGSPGWDRRIVEAFERFADGIALVWGNDLHQFSASPTFPALSREAIEALGAVSSPLLNHYHIESHLHEIFLELRRLGHDRMVFLEDVVFEHYHPEGSIRPQRQRGRDDRVTFATLAEERGAAARRLARRIEALQFPEGALDRSRPPASA